MGFTPSQGLRDPAIAPRMGWMISFSTLSRFTFDHGLRCTEREPETLPDLWGKGSRKPAANKAPNLKPIRKQSWQSLNCCFLAVEFFTSFFTALFATLFAALFAALLGRSFAWLVPVNCRDREFPFMSQQGVMSNEVGQYKKHLQTCHHGGEGRHAWNILLVISVVLDNPRGTHVSYSLHTILPDLAQKKYHPLQIRSEDFKPWRARDMEILERERERSKEGKEGTTREIERERASEKRGSEIEKIWSRPLILGQKESQISFVAQFHRFFFFRFRPILGEICKPDCTKVTLNQPISAEWGCSSRKWIYFCNSGHFVHRKELSEQIQFRSIRHIPAQPPVRELTPKTLNRINMSAERSSSVPKMCLFLLKCWICWIMLNVTFEKCASFCWKVEYVELFGVYGRPKRTKLEVQ